MNVNLNTIQDILYGKTEIQPVGASILRVFQLVSISEIELDNIVHSDIYLPTKELSKEELWSEWKSWALNSKKPSLGLKFLKHIHQLENYPQLFNLQGVPQNKINHPEGDVWTHTLYTVDEARKISDRENLSKEERILLIFAALCHDMGKPSTVTMVNGDWSSPLHEIEGLYSVSSFMKSIGAPQDLINKVMIMVKYHLSHLELLTDDYVLSLAEKIKPIEIPLLVNLMEADNSGRPPSPKGIPEKAKLLEIMYKNLAQKTTPFITNDVVKKLALRGDIPIEYANGTYHNNVIVDEMLNVQKEGLVRNVKEAVDYVISLLNFYENSIYKKLEFLVSLDMNQRSKLASKNLTEDQIMSMSISELQAKIES